MSFVFFILGLLIGHYVIRDLLERYHTHKIQKELRRD